MSGEHEEPGVVGQTIKDLLPVLNEGFNWEIVTGRYDKDPTQTALTIEFTNEGGDKVVEHVTLGVMEGPEITILEEVPEHYKWMGAIVTYQDYGIRILDPNDDMTPDRARYTHRGVQIQPAEGESRERLWLVASSIMESMLESVVWKQQQAAQSSEQ